MLFFDSLIFKSLKLFGVGEKTSLNVVIILKNIAVAILLLFAFKTFKDDLVRGSVLFIVLLIHSFMIIHTKAKTSSS
ncbi:MAG: hypothetical protein AMXMBFR79_18930 [Chitinophagaceae bacterium]|nr:hypothetical protein [Chitinophagales bacterium]